MSDKLTTTHRGIAITYDETEDKWSYSLRGKDKQKTLLSEAKADIDAPPPKDKKAFKRFEVWYKSWNSIPVKATVTSFTEPRRFNPRGQARITFTDRNGNVERKNVDLTDLYADTADNAALVRTIKALYFQAETLHATRLKAEGRMTRVNIKPEDYA